MADELWCRVERGPGEHLTAVLERDSARVRGHGGRLGPETADGDLVPGLERVARPSIAHQPVRRAELEVPHLRLAGFVFTVDEQPRVRIRPFELLDRSAHGDGAGPIELRGKRMMSGSWKVASENQGSDERGQQAIHGGAPFNVVDNTARKLRHKELACDPSSTRGVL